MFKNIYKNKKVFITGHTGFKGSWLTLWLLELGAEVAGYALEPETNPALFNELKSEDRITHIVGDIKDFDKLKSSIQEYQPEIIFHLASQALVRRSYKEPKHTYETNVIGLINLLEAIRETESVKGFLNVTSDKCYENKEQVYGYRESDSMGGYDPYSSSKGCSELITSAYRNSFFNPVDYGKTHNVAIASGRAGNVIGGGDWSEDRLIPDCIKNLSQNNTLVLRSPEATRPWQHVLEPLSGYLWLASLLCNQGMNYAQGWNFGPNNEDVLEVKHVVSKIINFWGSGKYEIDSVQNPHEACFLKLDISKSKHFLKWNPTYNNDEAILNTVNWYKNFYQRDSNIQEFTLKQINDYVQKASSIDLEWAK